MRGRRTLRVAGSPQRPSGVPKTDMMGSGLLLLFTGEVGACGAHPLIGSVSYMKHWFLASILNTLLFLGGPLCAQSVHVLPGDAGFSTSSVWPSPVLQWGPRFTYTSPTLPPGIYQVVFTFQEPTVTGPNQRLFTVGLPGATSRPLDLWSLAGSQPVSLSALLVQSFPGPIVITFAASVRNAVISSIDITPIQSIVTSGQAFIEGSCIPGYSGARLADGLCLLFSFSQIGVENNSGQTPPPVVH